MTACADVGCCRNIVPLSFVVFFVFIVAVSSYEVVSMLHRTFVHSLPCVFDVAVVTVLCLLCRVCQALMEKEESKGGLEKMDFL